MDKKWSIIDRKDVKEKCFQLEAAVRSVFESPGSWVNGYIRLVSLEGTWYHHRATDIFIPMAQNYMDKSYRAEAVPEKASTRLKSGAVSWDYMDEEEALQIFPSLPASNMPKAVGTAGLAERCKNKRIFVADGKVYDSDSKKVRPLQKNEEGTVLQVYRLDDVSQRRGEASWYYDIYLWAKLGVVPSALYSSKDSWNTMQFLINNFNNIDFGDFLALQGEVQPEPEEKQTVKAKKSVAGGAVPPRPSMYGKTGSAAKTATPPRPVMSAVEKPTKLEEAEVAVKAEIPEKTEPAVKEEAIPENIEPKLEAAEKVAEKQPVKETVAVEKVPVQLEEPIAAEKSAENRQSEESVIVQEDTEDKQLRHAATEEPTKLQPEEPEDKQPKEAEAVIAEEISAEQPRIAEESEPTEPVAGEKDAEEQPEAQKEMQPEMPVVVIEESAKEQSEAVKQSEPIEPVVTAEEAEAQPEAQSETQPEMPVATEEPAQAQPEIAEEPDKQQMEVAKKEEVREPVLVEDTQEAQSEADKEVQPEEPEAEAEAALPEQPESEPKAAFTDKPEPEQMAEEKAEPVSALTLEPEAFSSGEPETSGWGEAHKQAGQLSEAEEMDVQKEIIQEEEIIVSEDKIQELLDCDKNRCRLEPYDRDILYDIIRGHWELFEEAGATKESAKGRKSSGERSAHGELIARDPKLDIRQGVVGIDFGTKSTVVVRQDATNRIVPIRIGTGNLSDDVKEEDFENPSIIEFTNVQKFLEEYLGQAGRPHTSCNDVFVSYDAYEDFRNCKPDDFYAYFSELKQWANHEKGTVVIKDKQKREYYLGEGMDMEECTVNPVELYAYYIGLYINNMRNGIYLKYLMTFPVGYAKETRDFIAESFYNGIKKSLPSSILNDKECMEQFKVELGISEPAAYAITALEQNHLEPADETERLMYGIFDFGGGTTDFDFGICRGATEEEYEKDAYDYVLECFGADSDVTLGGENILELMAYHVYQQNLDVFREKKITFTLPAGENSFAGSETLLINSQIARRNMAILKEELRPLWHQEQGWRKKYQLDSEAQNDADREGIIVSLYNMNGEPVPQCMLEFSSQDLVELIKNRIQKGIDSFFQCLIKIFLYKGQNKKEENTIYIFLAGNSSKSVFVKELFQKKIEEYYGKSKKLSEEMENVHFKLIDPLSGKGEAVGAYIPNAKTGVAYGLLKSRPGSSIKIEKNYETDAMQQSRFHYYLGRDRRHHFDCKFSPMEVGYKKWVRFQGASREVVRIYFTNNPTADSKLEQMPIENVPYKEINIDVKEDAYLFIRTVEPDMIEYVVAKEVEEISDSDIRKCYFN